MNKEIERIEVFVYKPGEEPAYIEIDNTLEAMQAVVGGPIEVAEPWGGDVVIICNEEGKLQYLEPNRIVVDGTGRFFDVIYGPCFICMAPRHADCFMSLPRMYANKFAKYMVTHLEEVVYDD